MGTKQLNIRIDEDLLESVKAKLSDSNDQNVSEFIRQIIKQQIDPFSFLSHNPIINEEEYIPFGRKILMADYDNVKSKVYEREIHTKSFIVTTRGSVPDMIVESETVRVPTYRIATNPFWDIDDDCPEYREQVIKKSQRSLDMQEDEQVIQILSSSVPDQHKFVVSNEDDLISAVRRCRGVLREHLISPQTILVHPRFWETYREAFTFSEQVNVFESVKVPLRVVYFLGKPETIGVILISKDTSFIECDDPRAFKKGMVIYRRIGLAVINDYCIAQITMESK